MYNTESYHCEDEDIENLQGELRISLLVRVHRYTERRHNIFMRSEVLMFENV
jgi:hypothetical protein